MTVSIAARIF